MSKTRTEWRAVFSYPPYLGRGGMTETPDSYGPPRPTREAAEADPCWRSEESHGYRSGVQRREVTDWEVAP